MKKKLSAILGALAACTLLVGLGGCTFSASDAQNGNAIANPTTPVTMSQAFNTKSIWYADTKPGIDEEFEAIVVFDGKGNATIYSTCADDCLTFSDIENLSDEEIIDMAKERANERGERPETRSADSLKEMNFEARENYGENIKVGNMYLNGYVYSADRYEDEEQYLHDEYFGFYTKVPENHPGFID